MSKLISEPPDITIPPANPADMKLMKIELNQNGSDPSANRCTPTGSIETSAAHTNAHPRAARFDISARFHRGSRTGTNPTPAYSTAAL